MDLGQLDQLAEQLKTDKHPACRRAINRILAEFKKRCEKGEFANPVTAESEFRKSVDEQTSCQETRTT